MLPRIFEAQGILPLEFKPARTFGGMFVHHLDGVEQESEKNGFQPVLADHFAGGIQVESQHRYEMTLI